MKSVADIISLAGGESAIAATLEKVSESTPGVKRLSVSAIRKWRMNGIPDRYWSAIKDLAEVTSDDLLAANNALRTAPSCKSRASAAPENEGAAS